MEQTSTILERDFPRSASTPLTNNPTSLGFFSPRPKSTSFRRLPDDRLAQLRSQSQSPTMENSKTEEGEPSVEGRGKLRYDSIALVGRQWERGLLNSCFSRLLSSNRVTSSNGSISSSRHSAGTHGLKARQNYKELIWIKGYSGAGVSTLAKTLERAVASTPRGLLIEGKFDSKSSDEPYSGLLLAIGQIFQKLVGGKMSMRRIMVRRRSGVPLAPDGSSEMAPEEFTRVPPAMQKVASDIADALRAELGPELDLLTTMIPYLENILRRGRQDDSVRYLEQSIRNSGASTRVTDQKLREFDRSFRTLDESNLSSNGSRNVGSNDSQASDATGHDHLDDGFQAGEKRLKYAFRILMRVLSTYFHPLVLVQDDLQWADAASLDVLDYLISDMKNTNPMMIVGCYRSDEGQDKRILRAIRNLSAKSVKHQFHVTTVDVQNFSVRDVNQIVLNMLQVDNEHVTQPLAELVHRRTFGNPHFTVEFVKMLDDEKYIEYNERLSRWVWDLRMVEKLTASTDNVKDLLLRRMKKLSPDMQKLLPYAACWGSCFHESSLQLTVSEHAGINIDSDIIKSMGDLLVFLQENQYVEKIDEGTYIWVHDQVQEAALSLIDPSTTKEAFQFEIGCILFDALVKMDKTSVEVSIFNMADLINQGNVKRRPDFAQLNLQAAEKARDISALRSAAKYVSHGIKLLPSEKWENHYQLTLRLYTLGAEVELAIGHVKIMQKYYRAVVSQENCTKLDKLPLYISQFHKLSSVDFRFLECIDFVSEVLKEFGCDLIWSRFTVGWQAKYELSKMRRMIKRLPTDFHEAKPLMTKPKHKAIMLLLSKLLYACYAEDMHEIQILCSARLVQMTLQHGVHDVSGFGFTVLGMLVNKHLKDWEEASAIAEIGLLLQQRLQHGYSTASTMYTAHNFILPWTQPFESSIMPLHEGFVAGMRAGNVLFGTGCLIAQYVYFPYFLGMNLQRIMSRIPDCIHRLREMKQIESVAFLNMQWQMFKNLTGDSAESTVLEGDVFDPSMMNPFHNAETYFARLQLLIYYGDYAKAASLSTQWGKSYQKTETGHPSCMTEAFHRGVANYAMARRTRRKRFEEEALKARRLIASWSESGCPNVIHFHLLLNAEQAALELRDLKAEGLYKEAIMMAESAGLIHDAALFYERYADFLRQPHATSADKELTAQSLIAEAIVYYDEWGAKRKVAILRNSAEASYSA
ncbi:unnamed protein product [Cylindrotheca closterium]|uniref:Orc1-like AAA ATPase domain-containing protein n=1 Tax=Cylindrotheca closterium TaxID=2856 RepID=A0AAD2CMZ9_9STRA|nr:unnamed protein product [Cylindrotheca closterium]